MRHLDIEGGCWYVETEDGKRYEPAGEDLHQLLIDGLWVELRVKSMVGVSSVCQVGELVEVISILDLKKSEDTP
jgi:hypothetical protein